MHMRKVSRTTSSSVRDIGKQSGSFKSYSINFFSPSNEDLLGKWIHLAIDDRSYACDTIQVIDDVFETKVFRGQVEVYLQTSIRNILYFRLKSTYNLTVAPLGAWECFTTTILDTFAIRIMYCTTQGMVPIITMCGLFDETRKG